MAIVGCARIPTRKSMYGRPEHRRRSPPRRRGAPPNLQSGGHRSVPTLHRACQWQGHVGDWVKTVESCPSKRESEGEPPGAPSVGRRIGTWADTPACWHACSTRESRCRSPPSLHALVGAIFTGGPTATVSGGSVPGVPPRARTSLRRDDRRRLSLRPSSRRAVLRAADDWRGPGRRTSRHRAAVATRTASSSTATSFA